MIFFVIRSIQIFAVLLWYSIQRVYYPALYHLWDLTLPRWSTNCCLLIKHFINIWLVAFVTHSNQVERSVSMPLTIATCHHAVSGLKLFYQRRIAEAVTSGKDIMDACLVRLSDHSKMAKITFYSRNKLPSVSCQRNDVFGIIRGWR